MKTNIVLVASGFILLKSTAVFAAVHYVDANSVSPAPPFSTWATAATNIQDAVDIAASRDEVIVTNGIYATGSRTAPDSLSSRVVVGKPLWIHSVNGAQVTIIQGYRAGAPTNYIGAIRCMYMTNGASLSGFTLTNGAANGNGGGLYCAGTVLVSNCTIVGNAAQGGGGGAYQGTFYNCVLFGNSAEYGGGAFTSTLSGCTLASNYANSWGGGVTGAQGGTASYVYSSLDTSIAQFNLPDNYGILSHLSYCCATPAAGDHVIGDDPLFVDLSAGNLRLQSNSPCINAGNNNYVATSTDYDGNPRIINGTVDMGAYEYQGPSGLTGFHAWLAWYGLPTDGSADYVDSDGDGMNNWQEWRAGTVPTYAPSLLRMVAAVPSGTNVAVSWQSVLGVGYYVQRSTNVGAAAVFTTIATNIPGQPVTTMFLDTNPVVGGRSFYRVGVQ